MEGANTLSAANPAHRRVVRLPDGSILNRYWDDTPKPRPESYLEDVKLAQESGRNPEELYRHIRTAAESGWDFSSRWFSDADNLRSIHTTGIIPVDLNALLFHTEMTLAQMAEMQGNKAEAKHYEQKARDRRKALLEYTWNEDDSFFYDDDFVKGTTTNIPSLAAVFLYTSAWPKRSKLQLQHRK